MIESIKNYYNAPSPCLDLCAPLQKYQQFFADQNEEATGFSKVALTIVWIATAFFAYPIFGLLAAVGVAIKIATGQQVELDPVNMTTEELQVWGQNPSTTTQLWNEVQLKRLNRFIDVGIALAGGSFIDLLQAGEHYHGPVTQQNPLGGESTLYEDWLWLRDVDGSSKEAEAAAEKLLNDIAEELSECTTGDVRVEIQYVYQLGGDADPHNQGMAYVSCRALVSAASPIEEVNPVDMTDEQLKVWGQDSSVTTERWNGVQLERMHLFLAQGVALLASGKFDDFRASEHFSGQVSANPWLDETVFACSTVYLLAADDLLQLLEASRAGVLEYTNDGVRIEMRYRYQLGGDGDPENLGVAHIACLKAACPADSAPLATDPAAMTDEQLKVWGEDPAVTTVRWNEVQLERMNRFFATVPFVPHGSGRKWEGEPALLNIWCRLFSVYNPSEPTIETATGRIADVVQTASASGERVEIRYAWTKGGGYDPSGYGIAFINCRKI